MEYVLRYDIKPDRATEFRAWITDNTANLAAHAAEGWTYRGTYFTVRGFGDYSNETRWEIDDYAALGAGFGDQDSVRLTQEWMDFVDQTRPFQATLYKSASDVEILPGT
jgi:hypothetical protein